MTNEHRVQLENIVNGVGLLTVVDALSQLAFKQAALSEDEVELTELLDLGTELAGVAAGALILS